MTSKPIYLNSWVQVAGATLSVTPVAGVNTCLIIFAGGNGSYPSGTCTVNGSAATAIGSINDSFTIKAFYFLNPPAGTYNVVTSGFTNSPSVMAVEYCYVNQTTPYTDLYTTSNTSNSIYHSFTGIDGNIRICGAGPAYNSSATGGPSSESIFRQWLTGSLGYCVGVSEVLPLGSRQIGTGGYTGGYHGELIDFFLQGDGNLYASNLLLAQALTGNDVTTPSTQSFTCPVGTQILYVAIGIHWPSTQLSGTSCKYNSVAMTSIGSQVSSSDTQLEVFRMINPPSGTYNIDYSWTGGTPDAIIMHVLAFRNVNSSTPEREVQQLQKSNVGVSCGLTLASTTIHDTLVDFCNGRSYSTYTPPLGATNTLDSIIGNDHLITYLEEVAVTASQFQEWQTPDSTNRIQHVAFPLEYLASFYPQVMVA